MNLLKPLLGTAATAVIGLTAVTTGAGAAQAFAIEPPMNVNTEISEGTATVTVDGLQPLRDDSTVAVTVWHEGADLDKLESTELLYTNAMYLHGKSTLTLEIPLQGQDASDYVLSIRDDSGLGVYQGDLLADDVDVTVPDAPAAPTVDEVDGVTRVTWEAPADGGSPLTGYSIIVTGGSGTSILDALADATSIDLPALAAGTYTVRVVAENAVGASDTSPMAEFTVTAGSGTPVPTPTGDPTETPRPTDAPEPTETGPAETSIPKPTDSTEPTSPSEPLPVPGDDLDEDHRGSVAVQEAAYPGQTIPVFVGEEWTGEEVVIWIGDMAIASVTVDATGATRITVPTDLPFGHYELVVNDAAGNLIGWDDIEIVKESQVGPKGELLSQTGAEIVPYLVGAGVLALAGAGVLLMQKRRRASKL